MFSKIKQSLTMLYPFLKFVNLADIHTPAVYFSEITADAAYAMQFFRIGRTALRTSEVAVFKHTLAMKTTGA